MKHIEHKEGGMYGIAPLFCGEKHMALVKCLKQNGIIELNPPISLDLFGKHKGEWINIICKLIAATLAIVIGCSATIGLTIVKINLDYQEDEYNAII